jgi:hypothetical protein
MPPTPTPADIAAERALAEQQIILLLQIIWDVLAYGLNPFASTASGTKAFNNLARVPALIQSILTLVSALAVENFDSTHNLLYTLLTTVLGPFGKTAADDYSALIKGLLDAYNANLVAGKITDPTQVDVLAASALEEASALGIGARVVTSLFELFLPKQLNSFNWLGPTLAQFSGYDKIVELWRDPLLQASIGNLSEYNANSEFRTEAPSHRDAEHMYAKRLITPAQLTKLIGWSGLMTEFEAPMLATAFHGIQPRMLTNLLVDQDFPTAVVTDALQFSGLRDADIAFMLPALMWNSVKTVRGQYVSSIVRSAELGSITEAELTTDLQGLNYSAQAINLVILQVAQKRLDAILTLYRREIDVLYSTNQLTDAQYVASLTAAGLDASLADGYYGVASAKLHGKELAAAARAAAKLEAQETKLALSSAKSLYLAGSIDAVAMAAAVTASGLDLNLVPLTVALFTAEYSAKRQDVYGVLLPRDKAILLREIVAAMAVQVRAGLITPDMALNALASNGVPAANAQALVSEWAATKLAASSVGVLLPR